MNLSTKILDIVRSYTKNEITMGQTYHLIVLSFSEWEADNGPGMKKEQIHRDAFILLGIPMDVDSEIQKEAGFNGNHFEWFKAGNRPEGWMQTRSEYLESKKG